MTCKMNLDLYYDETHIEKELIYHGDSYVELAENIDRDTNELVHYMRTFDEQGEKTFCFSGFCFLKRGLIAASLSEPEF